jgi:hypothetical protein
MLSTINLQVYNLLFDSVRGGCFLRNTSLIKRTAGTMDISSFPIQSHP